MLKCGSYVINKLIMIMTAKIFEGECEVADNFNKLVHIIEVIGTLSLIP